MERTKAGVTSADAHKEFSAFVFSLALSLTLAALSWLNLDYETRFGVSHVTSARMQ